MPLVARYGAAYADDAKYMNATSALYAPWVLAEVARASLIYGTDFNRTCDGQRPPRLLRRLQALRDPELGIGKQGAVGHFMLRVAGEQLTFQQSVYNDLSRPVALFEQTAPRRTLEVADSGWPSRLLGCTLQQYVATAIMLHTSALKKSGTFGLEWLTQPQFEEATREVPADVLRKVVEDHYAATQGQLRRLQEKADNTVGTPASQYRRFGFNPLSARPAVAELASTLLIPVPAYVVRKASSLGIYYTGLEQWGADLAGDLGELFEAYVGRQLGQGCVKVR